jgi:FkbM family methyltransferase
MNELQRIANFLGYRLINYGTYVRDQTRSVTHYRKRIDYPLDERSLVVDIGGLTGDWSQQIYSRYSCNIDIFEPHPKLFEIAKYNFEHSVKIELFNFGLGDENGSMTLYGDGNEASLYPNNNTTTKYTVEIQRASDIFERYYAGVKIDLLKLNIEGAEYLVLPDLIGNFDMKLIRNIQIQFHQNVPGYSEKRDAIRDALAKLGFVQTWNDEWVFENWEYVG